MRPHRFALPVFALSALLVGAPAVAAQAGLAPIESCATADSVVGAGPRRTPAELRHSYERILDTTRVEVRRDTRRTLSNPAASSFRLVSSFEGQTPRSAPRTVLQLLVPTYHDPESAPVTREAARLESAAAAAILVDNATRLRLDRTSHSAQVQQGTVLRGSRLLEVSEFALSDEVLRTLATARERIEIQIGPIRGGFGPSDLPAIREVYRLHVCAAQRSTPVQ